MAEDELTRYRLQSWKSQRPFDSESYFEQRLAFDSLTETQLRHLLAEPVEALRERFTNPPAWLYDLNAVLSQPCAPGFHHLIPDHLKTKPMTGFLNAAAPFIKQALTRFDQGIMALMRSISLLPFDPTSTKKIFFADLADALLNMLSRTMVLELNIARLSGELEGATSEERFQSFTQRFSQPTCLRVLLREYPVLARLLLEQTQRWVNVSLEFLERLAHDEAEIRAVFAPEGDLGILIGVTGGLADTHGGGRSVLVAKFSSGVRIVYKPKSLAVDAHFQDFLRWANARGASPQFPILTVLDRGAYGWVEYAKARECKTAEEVKRFYRRQGGYLALLYLLDATDFHAGNLIACGENPFLIDLEALFHPHRTSLEASDSDLADKIARRAISHSVFRIGLLPERVWSNSENEGVDISGLGTVDGQLTPHGLPYWEQMGTDAMHLVRKRKPIWPDKNRPQLNGAVVDVLDYREEILDGFAHTYSLLLKHRNELLSDDGPVARFAEDEVCAFLRSSRTYRRLLRESYHPDVLRDALDRDRLFDLLWVEVADDPDLTKIIEIERNDLLRGDIPQFTSRPASRDLWTGAGERIPEFFAESSMSIVRRRVSQLSHEDCERQAWIIHASLATLPMNEKTENRGLKIEDGAIRDPQPSILVSRLRAAAQAVGDRLEALALRGRDDASWIGLMLERDRFWSIERCGMDLDSGLPGVALFLAYLGQVLKQERYTALSQAALLALQRQIEERKTSAGLIGGFDGWGGVIYVLTHLGMLWNRPDLIAQAESVVGRLLPALIEEDDVLDVFGGAAGCIGSLRSLARVAPSGRVSVVAIQCGDHLLHQAQKMGQGIGWLSDGSSTNPFAGFAHGAAGIGWALLTLYDWTGLERFRAAAHEAMSYERSLFIKKAQNWPDLRENGSLDSASIQSQSGSMTAWCQGAVGIGLARLGSLTHADDPGMRAEIAATVETTLRHGFGHNHSLYHGDAGNLELLLQASRVLGKSEHEAQLRRLTVALLDSIEQHVWRCGTPFAVETPGLLTGLAGIGYELLRLAEPERVPSVLLLEPPLIV